MRAIIPRYTHIMLLHALFVNFAKLRHISKDRQENMFATRLIVNIAVYNVNNAMQEQYYCQDTANNFSLLTSHGVHRMSSGNTHCA